MAWNSDRGRRAPIATAVAVAAVVVGVDAVAAAPCDRSPTLSLVDVRYGLEPLPADHLGLDLRVRSVLIGWGGGCDVRRHAVELSDVEAPDLGDPGRTVVRLGTYRRGWQGDGWTAHVGLRGVVRWGGDWRVATPVVGGSLAFGRALVRAELDLGGLSLAALDARLDHRRTDLALEASVAWPDQSRARAEVRLRVRDLAMPGGADVRDVTVAAGVGLGLAVRDRLRALPAFVGVAGRIGDERTSLLVIAWNLGVEPL